jgi:hypothetical protein
MIYAMHCFMGRTVALTKQSLERVIHQLRKPSLQAYQTNLISRLLNSQVKSAMHGLMREVTWDVLEKLERELKTRKKTVWATSFCVISILCISIEDAQNAIDGFGMYTKFLGANFSSFSHGDCIQACRKLDDCLFAHLKDLFHGVFRTKKALSAGQKGYAFNPIRTGLTDFSDLDQSSLNLINDVRRVISDKGRYS